MGKQKFELSLTDRDYLEGLLRKGAMQARQFKRATGLLELDRGKSQTEISKTLGVSRETVGCWAKRYQAEGLHE